MSNEEYEQNSDAEINEFENEIQNEIDGDIDEGSDISEKLKRLPKKERLVQSILKFSVLCSDIVPTENKLRKTKVNQLEKLLARCISVSSGLSMKTEFNTDTNTKSNFDNTNGNDETEDKPSQMQVKGAEMLYMANIGMISVLEQLSRQTAEYTGVEIEGWSRDIKNDKENLMVILEAVYKENAQVVATYMSPSSMWALFMISSGSSHLKKASVVESQQSSP